MLLMSHCCSCISDYVHCTEIFFPFNSRSLNTKQSQHPAVLSSSCPWVGAGFQQELPAPSPAALGNAQHLGSCAQALLVTGKATPGLQQLHTTPTPHLCVQSVSHLDVLLHP